MDSHSVDTLINFLKTAKNKAEVKIKNMIIIILKIERTTTHPKFFEIIDNNAVIGSEPY